MACIHLTQSEEAINVSTGAPGVRHLCLWADAHPERLVDAPRWLQEWALAGGPTFNPGKHCVGCPAKREEAP